MVGKVGRLPKQQGRGDSRIEQIAAFLYGQGGLDFTQSEAAEDAAKIEAVISTLQDQPYTVNKDGWIFYKDSVLLPFGMDKDRAATIATLLNSAYINGRRELLRAWWMARGVPGEGPKGKTQRKRQPGP